MYSNFFETRKEMQQGIEILKKVLADFQRKENTSEYVCDCIGRYNSIEGQPAPHALKNWIRAQIKGRFSYGYWLAHYYPEILVKERLHDGYSVDYSLKSRKPRMLWVEYMISVLEKYLDDNKVEED